MAEDMIVEESTMNTEEAMDSVQSTNMIVEEEEEPESELDNLWKVVNQNPRDFTSWTYLLDYVEKGDDIENARKAFDQFLFRYPFCYGYWKKYAELEKKHHDLERCIEAYERGVKAIPMSVDLWTAYLDTALDIYQSSEDFEWTIKSIYERAIDAAGLEFRSDKLWEHFISWTSNNGRLSDATKIYDQLLRTATQMYYQNWENFKKHVEDNETQSIIPPEELEIWKQRLFAHPKQSTNNSATVPQEGGKDAASSVAENIEENGEDTGSATPVTGTQGQLIEGKVCDNEAKDEVVTNDTNVDIETIKEAAVDASVKTEIQNSDQPADVVNETSEVKSDVSVTKQSDDIQDDVNENAVLPKVENVPTDVESEVNVAQEEDNKVTEATSNTAECKSDLDITEEDNSKSEITVAGSDTSAPNESTETTVQTNDVVETKEENEDETPPSKPIAKIDEESITTQEKQVNQESTDSSGEKIKEEIKQKELSTADWNKIKTKFIEDREQVYQKTYEQITKRWYFEEKIRRPYFHVKPLEKSQLINWREYLDMEISEGDFKRVKSLFERCLIACALYEEYWIRYATYLESQYRIDDARRIWESACSVHLPHRPQLHLRWAFFEERQGNSSTAIEVITRGYRECGGDVKLAIRRLSLLRRSQSLSVESLRAEFESTIEKFASENIACASVLSLKYSRFLDREKGDREHAERVLREAIARDETNERLYMQLIDLNYRQPNFDWRACDRVLTWMVGLTSLPLRMRLRFCQRRYEILEETSNDIQAITTALRDFEEMEREVEASNELEAETSNVADTGAVSHTADRIDSEPPSKRSRTGETNNETSENYYSYDSYSYGNTGGGDHCASATTSTHYDSSGYGNVQSHSGSNPQAYAAAAAAAAANAAYPNYSGNGGNSSWDSYYNSYYGYYAGYYGAPGEHNDWQSQGMTG